MSAHYVPEAGHRVRVSRTWEGRVVRIHEDGTGVIAVVVGQADREPVDCFFTTRDGAFDFERIPDPEPIWQRGDILADSTGDTWSIEGDYARKCGTSKEQWQRTEHLSRPLTLLVRDSKHWTEQ